MSLSIESLVRMPEVELLAAYYDARRNYVEKKFARDSQRARLWWLRAKIYAAASGGVTERKNAVDTSEELGRKGQELREMTRDLDLLKTDVDLIAMIIGLRGAPAPAGVKIGGPVEDSEEEEGEGAQP
jgi:hypothetical protein